MTDSDILLLDISNNDEYIWTNVFDPTPPTSKPSMLSTISKTSSIIIGAVVGSFILLSFGIFLYKWNKNKKYRKSLIPIN